MAPNDRIVLLFCHGSSFTKETWSPITRYLQSSALMQRVPCEIVTFDWRYHGKKHDHSEPAEILFVDGNKRSCRVEHPARHWPVSSQNDLRAKIQEIRQQDDNTGMRTRIVAIGHSMGAAALLQFEVQHPGTFEGYIGFEPIYDTGALTDQQVASARDLLVSVSLAREGEWPTMEAAVEHIKSAKTFRRWHPAALEAYVQSAIINADGVYKLAMTPAQEAAAFCHEFIQFPPETLARAQCPLFIEHSERSFFFYPEPVHVLAEKLQGKLTVGAPLPKTSHAMVYEDPDASAERILADLAQLPLFQQA